MHETQPALGMQSSGNNSGMTMRMTMPSWTSTYEVGYIPLTRGR